MPDMSATLKDALTKKIGPLPAWAWGLVAGGGYLAYRALSGRSAQSEGVTEDTTAEYSGTGYDSSGGADGASVSVESGSTPASLEGYVPESLVEEMASDKAEAKWQKLRARNWRLRAQKLAARLKRQQKKKRDAKRQANKNPKTKRRGHDIWRADRTAKRDRRRPRERASRSWFHNRTQAARGKPKVPRGRQKGHAQHEAKGRPATKRRRKR